MSVKNCPTFGPIVTSTFAGPLTFPERIVGDNAVSKKERVSIPGSISIIPVAELVQAIQSTKKTLEGLRTHPPGSSFVGVLSDSVKDLELVLVRTSRVQSDIEDTNLEEDSKREALRARELRRRLQPLVEKLRKSDLSAEEFYQAVCREKNPDNARAMFISLSSSSTTIIDDQMVLTVPEKLQERTKTLNSATTFLLNLAVISTDSKSAESELLLVGAEGPCLLFSDADYQRRSILLKNLDHESVEMLSLCQAFRITFKADLSISLVVGSRGYSYSGAIARFVDKTAIYRQVQIAVSKRAKSLFA